MSFRRRAGIWIRKRGLGPYLLLLPATAVIAALILWPAVQVGLFSFQNYGLMQISGVLPTQWIGFANYSQILHDPEFWSSLKISVYFAVAVVPLTLIIGTLVGLLLERLGPRMRTFVSISAILAWATPAVSASVIFAWLVDPDGGRRRLGAGEGAVLAGRRPVTGRASAGPTPRFRPTPC